MLLEGVRATTGCTKDLAEVARIRKVSCQELGAEGLRFHDRPGQTVGNLEGVTTSKAAHPGFVPEVGEVVRDEAH